MRGPTDERPPGEVRVVYADLDGTLLGPGGCLFAAPEGGITDRAVRALLALHEAGIGLVLMSGRTRRSIREVARVLGARAYIAELGAMLVERDGPEEDLVRNFGSFAGDGWPFDEIARSGAGAFLLERFHGKLEPVAPWTEATMMFQGSVDPEEATTALSEAGYGWLVLHDNGRMRRPPPPGLDVVELHALHLLPRGVDKASAVRLHRDRHGITAGEAAGVGDSPADLAVAGEVGTFFLVANGATLGHLEDAPRNVRVTDAAYGDGFAEAVEAVLPR